MKYNLRELGIKHISIIMDGNGRWAEKRGLPRVAGHERGAASLRKIVKYSGQIGLEYLSVFAFSSENWKRPKQEVESLMNLLVKFCEKESNSLKSSNCRIKFIGDIESMPQKQRDAIKKIEDELSSCTGLKLCIFMNYGGRSDFLHASRMLLKKALENVKTEKEKLSSEEINKIIYSYSEDNISDFMLTSGIPDPDLLIRTGGEKRISNFMLWQISYSELLFSDVYWPDFNEKAIDEAVNEFAKRTRRFGGI